VDLTLIAEDLAPGDRPARRAPTGPRPARAAGRRTRRPDFAPGLRAAVGRVRRTRRDGAARGDPRTARVGTPRKPVGAAALGLRAARAAARRWRRAIRDQHGGRARGRAWQAASGTHRGALSHSARSRPEHRRHGIGSAGCARCRCKPRGAARPRPAARRTRPSYSSRRWRCAAPPGRDDPKRLVRRVPTRAWRGCARTSAPVSGWSIRSPLRTPRPDFRPPELLAGDAPRPVSLGLVVRRVGRESETTHVRAGTARGDRRDLRGVRSARAGRGARAIARGGSRMDGSPGPVPVAISHGVITAYHIRASRRRSVTT